MRAVIDNSSRGVIGSKHVNAFVCTSTHECPHHKIFESLLIAMTHLPSGFCYMFNRTLCNDCVFSRFKRQLGLSLERENWPKGVTVNIHTD